MDLSARVEFLDPSLHTAQVERLEALLAIPKSRSLIDDVLANSTLNSAFTKPLDKFLTFFRQKCGSVDEVVVVVLHSSLLFVVVLFLGFLFHELKFLGLLGEVGVGASNLTFCVSIACLLLG